MNAAVEFELLKGRRSNVLRWGALVMVVGVPALSTCFFSSLASGVTRRRPLVSSWGRGYLAGFVTLVAVVVATQIITAVGGGAWFPYAAPSLWMGLGGPDAARDVTAVQLLVPLAVAVVGVLGTTHWWRQAEAS